MGPYTKSVHGFDELGATAIIHCLASVTWSERSDRFSADNYRAELLGAIALQLLVQTACEGKYISPCMRPQIGCDNAGVVHHGNHPWRPVATRQLQADLLRYNKELVRSCPVKCHFYHVHSHLDQFLASDQLTLAERLNCACDKLAGLALDDALSSGEVIS